MTGSKAIAERITIGKGEIVISLCCLPPSKDMAKGWRKGWDLSTETRLLQEENSGFYPLFKGFFALLAKNSRNCYWHFH